MVIDIMRFRKGSKVEVLSKKEVPSGSWRCGEIISGNGHTYDVKYDLYSGITDTATTKRVSRKHIRPCPPLVEDAIDWVAGDHVEVLDDVSWKIATVLKVMGGSYFLVKTLDSSQELRVHKSYLRLRQSWQYNRWVVVGESSTICDDEKSDKLSTSRIYRNKNFKVQTKLLKAKQLVGDNRFTVENGTFCQESNMDSLRASKRVPPNATSEMEAHTGAGRKRRAIEKDGRRQHMVSDHPSSLMEKVAVTSPLNVLGEKYMHCSFMNRSELLEMDMERADSNGDLGCVYVRSLESNDTDSTKSSVGSCSSNTNSPCTVSFHSLTNPSQSPDDYSSDAESFCGSGFEKKALPTEEELAEEIHKIELEEYRSTMEELYASGPLSWEQEELLTIIRLKLHISNDEHLMEIKRLVSAETYLPIR